GVSRLPKTRGSPGATASRFLHRGTRRCVLAPAVDQRSGEDPYGVPDCGDHQSIGRRGLTVQAGAGIETMQNYETLLIIPGATAAIGLCVGIEQDVAASDQTAA
ncbi:MAG: hypothetical protein KAU31_05595, partial [Spirochaetaceae bacterium]|nr:hypothetical protein [Spirochaetaceae bacterium]